MAAKCSINVAIVGGGLAGIATSIALKRAGHRVSVFERMPVLREIGAGIQLPPNATRLLKEWNVLPAVEAHAYTPSGGTLRSYRGKILVEQASSEIVKKVFGAPYLVIHRADLLNALVNEAQSCGVEINLGAEVTSIDFDGATLGFASGQVFNADLILGADGERSISRDALLGRSDLPRGTGNVVYRLVVDGKDVAKRQNSAELVKDSQINLWLGPNSHAVSYMLKNDQLNVVLICPDKRTEVPFGPQPASDEEVQEAFRGWDPKIADLLDAPSSLITKWSLLRINEVDSWCRPNFALIGDAAHAMLPYLAQGAAQAFEDVGVLSTLLNLIEDKSQLSSALQMYEQLRKPRTATVRRCTDAQKQLYGLEDGPEQEDRDKKIGQKDLKERNPNQLADPAFQKWLWGYDAIEEAKRAWSQASPHV